MHGVIEDAKARGLPDFIEPLAASFFESQLISGKYFGACFIGAYPCRV